MCKPKMLPCYEYDADYVVFIVYFLTYIHNLTGGCRLTHSLTLSPCLCVLLSLSCQPSSSDAETWAVDIHMHHVIINTLTD